MTHIKLFSKLLLSIFVFQGVDASNVTDKNEPESKGQKPNILFIIVDDLGWTDISTGAPNLGNGSRYYETPNVDRLAEHGMSFTNAYSNGPNCAPTRAALMSGQYGPRTKMYTVDDPNRGPQEDRLLDAADNKGFLDLDQVTMAEVIKGQGYTTGSFGKWHLGGHKGGGLPTQQGFDLNIAGTNGGGSTGGFFSNEEGAYPAKPNNPLMPGLPPNGKAGEWLDDRITGEALKFMDKSKENPFFVYMSFFAVHTPISSPEEDKAYFDGKKTTKHHNNQTYAGFVKSFDDNIGLLMGYLETTKDPRNEGKYLIENTLVVFISDNGGVGGFKYSGIEEFEATSQYPLRDGKGSMKEGGIRVPMIVRWDGHIEKGSVNHTPIITVDFYPTLASIVGYEIPKNRILDGENLTELYLGGELNERPLFWHFPAYLGAYGKFMGRKQFRTTPASVIRKGPWKLIYYYETRSWELYNLVDDIGENINLLNDNPKIVKDLGADLINWLTETKADLPKFKGTDKIVPLPTI